MKILEAITQLQGIKPNQYDDETHIRWLSDLDGLIFNEIIRWHEGADEVPHGPYSTDDLDTELLVQEPYSDVYIKYLAAQVDFFNAEMARYNNSMVMFNVALSTYADWYNRTHPPIQGNYITGAR